MNFEHLLLSHEGPVTRLTLNVPDQLNAMTPAMGAEIRDAVPLINGRAETRVVIVRGAGRAFSAGGSLKSIQEEVSDDADAGPGLGGGANFYRLYLSVRDLEAPSIAAINGHAIGAGLCFALGCDMRVIRTGARVGMTFVKLGIHPGMAATWTLPRLIGPARAAELLYSGRLIDAATAVEWGIASREADEDFDRVVEDLALEIAAAGPIAVKATKRTVRGTFERSIDEALDLESAEQEVTFRTADAREGVMALTQRRSPRFAGR
ncbi:MAG: enoyl-CoA hydratase-related protein [Acidobacteriota bacterium]|nr:enoyl-CoA hydratase-related protein [Acidobacteriota bacterium]